MERVVTFTTCPECGGSRLNEAARSSKIEGKNIADVCAMQISDLADWIRAWTNRRWLRFTGLQHLLDSFAEIGLGYFTRPAAGSLSGVKHSAPR